MLHQWHYRFACMIIWDEVGWEASTDVSAWCWCLNGEPAELCNWQMGPWLLAHRVALMMLYAVDMIHSMTQAFELCNAGTRKKDGRIHLFQPLKAY